MSRSTLVALTATLAAVALPGASVAAAAAPHEPGTVMHWTVDGVERDALVFAPPVSHGASNRPLVVAFHGHGGGMLATAARMRIHTLWPRAVVVYPQGLHTPTALDPEGTQPGWQERAGVVGDRDLRLFDAIVATMTRSHAVDRRRVYATGFSNGAAFSLLLWARRAETIAAIGEVAGRLHPAEALGSPRALLAVVGRADTVAPFRIQRQTIRQARRIDRATRAGSPCGRHCTIYRSTIGPVPVKAFVHPGGHVYPTWASLELVRFFKAHRQP